MSNRALTKSKNFSATFGTTSKYQQTGKMAWSIFKLPKKGNKKNPEWKIWGGITLLPVISKILGRILMDRITDGKDYKLREEQAEGQQNK